VINGVEYGNVKVTEALLVADSRNQFIEHKTNMIAVELCLVQPDW